MTTLSEVQALEQQEAIKVIMSERRIPFEQAVTIYIEQHHPVAMPKIILAQSAPGPDCIWLDCTWPTCTCTE